MESLQRAFLKDFFCSEPWNQALICCHGSWSEPLKYRSVGELTDKLYSYVPTLYYDKYAHIILCRLLYLYTVVYHSSPV